MPASDAPEFYLNYADTKSPDDYDDFHAITIRYYPDGNSDACDACEIFKGFWGYIRHDVLVWHSSQDTSVEPVFFDDEYGLVWHSSQDTNEEPVFFVGQQMIYYYSDKMKERFRPVCDDYVITEAFLRYRTGSGWSTDSSSGAESAAGQSSP